MLRLICILALLPFALQAQQSRFGEWKIDNAPALAPAAPSAWDDFAIGSASIVRLPNKWMMLYEGVALNEDGKSHAFGAAESADGIKWKKRVENPVFVPEHEWEIVTAPCVAKWKEDWLTLYIIRRAVTFEEKSPEDFNLPRESICLARSSDGANWEPAGEIKALSFKRTRQARPRPCIYSDADALHMWWIGEDENENPALFHSVSRDAETWSKPNQQLTKEIDPREIAGAGVRPSGDYYILTYVAFDEKNGPRFVTKVSQNARTWTAGGPPEFSLPAYFALGRQWQQPVPSIVFTKEGARLFYIDILFPKNIERPHPQRDAASGAVLRTAFSQKQGEQK